MVAGGVSAEKKTVTKHVDTLIAGSPDAGSIPAASTKVKKSEQKHKRGCRKN